MITALTALCVRWWFVYRYFSRLSVTAKIKLSNQPNLSVIIPLRGWDQSLPDLLTMLGKQKYSSQIEVMLVTDEPERLSSYPLPANINLIKPDTCPTDWQDKIWRLHQGLKHCQFKTIMFLDSDASIDHSFIARRLACHSTPLSFSLPMYINTQNSPARILASFTNYNNLTVYGLGFSLSPNGLPTAIGPCIVADISTAKLSDLLSLCATQSAGVDHALGYHCYHAGYRIAVAVEPISVVTDKVRLDKALGQIIRWLMLWRVTKHLIEQKLYMLTLLSTVINLIPFLLLITIFAHQTLGISFGVINCAAGIAFFIDAFGLLLTERMLFSFRKPANLAHLIFMPITQLLMPILFLLSLLRRQFLWRGKTVAVP